MNKVLFAKTLNIAIPLIFDRNPKTKETINPKSTNNKIIILIFKLMLGKLLEIKN
ncbi:MULTISPECIES: hypothetical protein [unclassified Exiguobacterium]|uniref:hypothetical protein n=1 Tax=unclassified Exiguobacterium TaxID=2644629 RepID=UPI001BE72523|nr:MULTISPECIES: hypothetical protein [unclassified Exiguobacterium]